MGSEMCIRDRVGDWDDDNLYFRFCNRLYALGVKFVDEELNPQWNCDEGVIVVEQMKKLWCDGLVVPESINIDSSGTAARIFCSGSAAMNINWEFQANWLNDPEYSVVIGKAKCSTVPGQKLKSGGITACVPMCIAKRAENPDAAWEYVKYCVSNEVQKISFLEGGHLPTNLKTYEDPEAREKAWWLPVAEEQAKLEGTWPLPVMWAAEQLYDIFSTVIKKAITDPNSDVKKALNTAEEMYLKEVEKAKERAGVK